MRRFFVNPIRVKDLQVKTLTNPSLNETQERQLIATFTPIIQTRVTKILCFYDESLAALEDLEISMKIKDANSFYFLDRAPLYTIANSKGGNNNHFQKVAFQATQEKEEIILTPTIELEIWAANKFTIPERKIFFLVDSYKDLK